MFNISALFGFPPDGADRLSLRKQSPHDQRMSQIGQIEETTKNMFNLFYLFES